MNRSSKILVIKSDKTELHKVENFLSDIFLEYNLPRAKFNRTFLCISEAVLNSIEHGNQRDCNKNISIKVDCCIKEIGVEINDEGEGFNINEVKNPTQQENIKKESGRGIYIIKSLTNSMMFNDKGNSVQFKLSVSE